MKTLFLAFCAVLALASAAYAESFGFGPNGVWINPYPQYAYPYAYPYSYPYDYHPPEYWRWRRHEHDRHEEHRR